MNERQIITHLQSFHRLFSDLPVDIAKIILEQNKPKTPLWYLGREEYGARTHLVKIRARDHMTIIKNLHTLPRAIFDKLFTFTHVRHSPYIKMWRPFRSWSEIPKLFPDKTDRFLVRSHYSEKPDNFIHDTWVDSFQRFVLFRADHLTAKRDDLPELDWSDKE